MARSRSSRTAVLLAVMFSVLVAPPSATAGAEEGTVPLAGSQAQAMAGEYLVRMPESAATALAAYDAVWVTEEWALVQLDRPGAPATVAAELSRELGTDVVPNVVFGTFGTSEPLFPQQWSLQNTGQTGGTPGADVDAVGAWSYETGDPSVIVAILDSGLDLDHPDLVTQLWTNTGEIPDNGVDDDGNGFVDDVFGWDFVPEPDDPVPEDELGHGTHVAGIVGAAWNGLGTAGLAPGVRLMAVRVCNATGSCSLANVAAGISYAVSQGADVVNLSLGALVPRFLVAPIEDAINNAPNVVFAAAAGNGGGDSIGDNNDTALLPVYPASLPLPNVMSVAATDDDDQLTTWSNYGPTSVDLGAPGASVLSTFLGGDWQLMSGTSMATPHVAGTVALVRSMQPAFSAGDAIQTVLDTVDQVASLLGQTVTGGRLNAAAAVHLASSPIAVAVATPSQGSAPLTVNFDGRGSTDPNGTIVSHQWAFSDGSGAAGALVTKKLSAGAFTATLTVTDNDGITDQATVGLVVNARPSAVASADVTLGVAPLTVRLNASGSADSDGSIKTFSWTFATDASAQTQAAVLGVKVTRTFGERGVHVVTLTVTDDFGASSTDQLEILVGTDYADTRNSRFRLDIAWLSALDITKGCVTDGTLFCPDRPVTRAQLATFLVRALGLKPVFGTRFADVSGLHAPAVNAIAKAGITRGCDPAGTLFCPDDYVTREQMASFLARALGLAPLGGVWFSDVSGIHAPNINAIAKAGITEGCDATGTRYCPLGLVTRGQMAAFLHRGLD